VHGSDIRTCEHRYAESSQGRSGFQIAPRGVMRTYQVNQGRIMKLTQQWRHLNLTTETVFTFIGVARGGPRPSTNFWNI